MPKKSIEQLTVCPVHGDGRRKRSAGLNRKDGVFCWYEPDPCVTIFKDSAARRSDLVAFFAEVWANKAGTEWRVKNPSFFQPLKDTKTNLVGRPLRRSWTSKDGASIGTPYVFIIIPSDHPHLKQENLQQFIGGQGGLTGKEWHSLAFLQQELKTYGILMHSIACASVLEIDPNPNVETLVEMPAGQRSTFRDFKKCPERGAESVPVSTLLRYQQMYGKRAPPRPTRRSAGHRRHH